MSECRESSTHVVAIVEGKPLTELPGDLFIPPDALEVLLDSFSGPLDLLLYLIRRQNIDILNIPITLITQQYMQYIQLMKERRLELAADYLVMAALLAEIKSRMLLPPVVGTQDEEADEDPRMTLVRRLQAYEQFKKAAAYIDALPRYERDVFQVHLAAEVEAITAYPSIELAQLAAVMTQLLEQQSHLLQHQIIKEPLSVRDRMNKILAGLQDRALVEICTFLSHDEGRAGLVVTLLATLELSRQSLVIIMQADAFAPIYLKAPHHG
ncbi:MULTISPECIES: segregation and condensation protein A [Legionella]|uniref:Segregation and condensation protein A n=1 Tax=Legionella septentrionalis TaxID=2498109 RepID=A0A433JLH3_9GAMM|nr:MULTISPECIES: ScpA family protein [Legionella]MCP0913495.1 segregation/condensation protein A [Legionella sp. 27cVA30]RUQ89729.1 segregation/condensation protein A [Legionella septentrionalis]RUQ99726.1 segregation/condensation protein A [Legionella septentrionalis]RUR11080.1 segregation/condensation protein A [Legionella septentrionalis]RUR15242.1 segregation/condensation protein A [Legionella septentrionalis]